MKRTDREGPIHRAILKHLAWKYPQAVIHHSPNEIDMRGKDVARQIAKARNKGTRKGWPDIEMILDGHFYAFEVKAPGNYPTDEQKDVGKEITASGGFWCYVRSIDDVQAQMAIWRAVE